MHALPLLYCNEGVLFRYEKIMISITYEKFTAISISINVCTCDASHCVIDLCFVFCVLCFVFCVSCFVSGLCCYSMRDWYIWCSMQSGLQLSKWCCLRCQDRCLHLHCWLYGNQLFSRSAFHQLTQGVQMVVIFRHAMFYQLPVSLRSLAFDCLVCQCIA